MFFILRLAYTDCRLYVFTLFFNNNNNKYKTNNFITFFFLHDLGTELAKGLMLPARFLTD